MLKTIPIAEVAELLRTHGHTLLDRDDHPGCVGLAPPPWIYLTLALEPDPVLKPEWRERFFVCEPDWEAILTIAAVPEEFRSRWEQMLTTTTAGLTFHLLGGLATWMTGQLLSSEKIYAWTDRPIEIRKDQRAAYFDSIEGELGSAIGSNNWRGFLEGETHARGLILDPLEELFPYVIAACFLFASQAGFEFCFVGKEGSAAFIMHHHDKVIASIPEAWRLDEILQAFEVNSDIFTDESDYESGGDCKAINQSNP